MIDDILRDAGAQMDKAIKAARGDFGDIRTGRANSQMFATIPVEYYGSATPMQQLASFQIPAARTVLITPYDRTATQQILRAIRDSDLGVNPTDDGKVIRVVLPELTAERRAEYVKQARGRAEEARVAIRAARRRAKEGLDRLKKDGEVGEDEADRAEKSLESLTRGRIGTVDSMLSAKESELTSF